ncbi:uncharacterized protein LOC121726087 [Aricia agestis]|uniref:uncharacterized protein LOC121726087 n=1 Tax=Aricia agestis TaxID=91739 RepID=UPI001C201874|nr:uncharacterized protein LOC121726087 [Aricia agestis]
MVKDSRYPHANASHFPEKAKNYMLILEDKSELPRNILQLNKLPTWNPLAKAIVYYEITPEGDAEETAILFINELRKHKLFKSIIFIYSPRDDEIVTFSWTPYSDTNCAGECDSVYVLDKCKDDVIYEVEPQREILPADLKGCPLTTYAVVSEPYVMPPTRKAGNKMFNDSYEFETGSEINLVKIISQFTNTSLIMRMSEEEENWGKIYSNGTATGAYGVLKNDSVDLVIGNIEVTKTIRKWFHPTISYTQDEMTWCVPKAGKASTWNNLIIIFQWTTWLATFGSLIVMGLVFHYLYYRENRGVTKWPTNSILMTLSMLLGWGALFTPKSSTFRILIFTWLCFSINISISYESFLRIFLMHPRFERQISSESDLIQSRIPLGGREIYRSYFETNNASAFYLYRKYKSTTFSEGIRRAALDRNFAVVSSRRQAEYIDQKLGKGAGLTYCFPESHNLYKYGVVLLARKWYPMLERFKYIIRAVSENGLIDKWNKELFIHTKSADSTQTIVPLSVQHLSGAFILIGILYTLGIVIFIIEVLTLLKLCYRTYKDKRTREITAYLRRLPQGNAAYHTAMPPTTGQCRLPQGNAAYHRAMPPTTGQCRLPQGNAAYHRLRSRVAQAIFVECVALITGTVITATGINATEITATGINATEITATGINATEITATGINATEITATGINATEITATGINATEITATGINATGINATEITATGINATEITATGINATEITATGINATEITATGINATENTATGINATEITATGINATEITATCINATEITATGINATEITATGINATEITATGINATEITATGINATGINATEITATGINATEITATGINATEITATGINATEITATGINATEITATGINATEITATGINATEITATGINATEFTATGINATEITKTGITASGTLLRAHLSGLCGRYLSYISTCRQSSCLQPTCLPEPYLPALHPVYLQHTYLPLTYRSFQESKVHMGTTGSHFVKDEL